MCDRRTGRQTGGRLRRGGVYVPCSTLFTGAVLHAHRDEEVICGIRLTFNDYHVVTYLFIATFTVSFIAAVKINFAVSAIVPLRLLDVSVCVCLVSATCGGVLSQNA